MMTLQILKSVDFANQKSRYLKNGKIFLQKKKESCQGYFIAKNSFVAEVIFKGQGSK